MWENIKTVNIKLPMDVLKEFVESFNTTFAGKCDLQVYQKNQEVIRAYVNSVVGTRTDVQSEIVLKLEADILHNYRLAVLTITYDISSVYPCKLVDNINIMAYECGTSDELQEKIVETFRSEKFINSASMIITQVDRETANLVAG